VKATPTLRKRSHFGTGTIKLLYRRIEGKSVESPGTGLLLRDGIWKGRAWYGQVEQRFCLASLPNGQVKQRFCPALLPKGVLSFRNLKSFFARELGPAPHEGRRDQNSPSFHLFALFGRVTEIGTLQKYCILLPHAI
jgi:hypothetical protein